MSTVEDRSIDFHRDAWTMAEHRGLDSPFRKCTDYGRATLIMHFSRRKAQSKFLKNIKYIPSLSSPDNPLKEYPASYFMQPHPVSATWVRMDKIVSAESRGARGQA